MFENKRYKFASLKLPENDSNQPQQKKRPWHKVKNRFFKINKGKGIPCLSERHLLLKLRLASRADQSWTGDLYIISVAL